MYTSEPDNIKNRENDVFPSLECSRKRLKQQMSFLAELQKGTISSPMQSG